MKYTIVGLIFFGLLIISFNYTIVEKTNTDLIYPYRMKLYYTKIDGLREGTEVSVKGVDFGLVQEIKKVPIEEVPDQRFLEPGKSHAIELTLIMRSPITLWENYDVKFKNKTSFSGRSIDIDPGYHQTEESKFFHPTYTKEENPPAHSPSAKYYDDFFVASHNTLEENRSDIRRTMINLRELSVKLKGEKGTLPQLTNTDLAYNGLLDTTADARIVLKEFRRYQEGIRESDTIFIPFSLVLYRQLVGSIYGNQY
ncbi:MAG TPA: MlaD family protein [Leptospiraceae bacterium]|nr:MlaD family protein [Leptospiraceae bacterium]HMW05413.1 MlaD family protein [Leptospiraceae bacterium]HMX31438.1 MlaD family protein [Leptospiraceae bacterium]HMY30923.1 MlaD family protein [Leptospiraceae bacterium]HMZ63334.1 MlaD family protein [Leptospiraceae bacterium]